MTSDIKAVLKGMSLDELRETVGVIIKSNPNAGPFWDIITCQRGPDAPSERPDQSGPVASAAYAARRKRKFNTVEVIRSVSFGGFVGGAARSHEDDKVILPPQKQWDHFDKHVARAANVLGLKVEVEGE